MKRTSWLLMAAILVAVPSICGCTVASQSAQTAPTAAEVQLAKPSYEDILQIANEHQHTVDDGWYYGEMPRIFKSEYLLAAPEVKARFAIDFADMLQKSGQDMLARWDSYVSYLKRSDFALAWWSNPANSQSFAQQTKKAKVLWIHDAVMDASELWWRAFEKKNEGKIIDTAVMAHDEEQKRVFDYTDQPGHPRSYSDEFVRFR